MSEPVLRDFVSKTFVELSATPKNTHPQKSPKKVEKKRPMGVLMGPFLTLFWKGGGPPPSLYINDYKWV